MLIHAQFGDNRVMYIRASVDTLCRDGTSEISRDPRKRKGF